MGSRTRKNVSSDDEVGNATRGVEAELDQLRKMTAMLARMHTPDLRPGPLPLGYEASDREFKRICKACEVFWWPCPTLDAMVKYPAAEDIIGKIPKVKPVQD